MGLCAIRRACLECQQRVGALTSRQGRERDGRNGCQPSGNHVIRALVAHTGARTGSKAHPRCPASCTCLRSARPVVCHFWSQPGTPNHSQLLCRTLTDDVRYSPLSITDLNIVRLHISYFASTRGCLASAFCAHDCWPLGLTAVCVYIHCWA